MPTSLRDGNRREIDVDDTNGLDEIFKPFSHLPLIFRKLADLDDRGECIHNADYDFRIVFNFSLVE